MPHKIALALLLAVAPAAGAQAPYGASSAARLPDPPPLVLPPKPNPPKLEHIQKLHAEGVLGQPVLDLSNKPIGHIVNVLIDQKGAPKAAVIEFAGFFGVGDRNIAVAWSALHFSLSRGKIAIMVTLNATKLKALPAYKSSAASVPVATQPHAKAAP